MRTMVRLCGVTTTLLSAALLAVGCGGGHARSREIPVTSQLGLMLSTRDIHCRRTAGQRCAWPTVIALHGIGGSGQDMGEFATRLARAGTVAFAPTYRSDLATADRLNEASQDIVCGYRFARTTASQHGGDLAQPVTALGWSLGANFAVLGGLSPATGSSPDHRCPGDKNPPDVIVGISGCYYEYERTPVTWFNHVSTFGTRAPTSTC